jgi:hypothetical protein
MTTDAQKIGDGMSDEELLAKYVELERFAETTQESFADGFVRVLHKKAVLARMKDLRDTLDRANAIIGQQADEMSALDAKVQKLEAGDKDGDDINTRLPGWI